MCDTCELDTIRLEVIDSRDTPPEVMQPVIDAAFAASKAQTCCLNRKNAVHRAVFETARGLGYRVAWGNTLREPGEPDYFLWPEDSWKTETIRRHLESNHAHEIHGRDLR